MNDLDAVRRLAAEPTDESVSRTWYRITKLQAGKAPRRRRRFLPAVAGLAVVASIAASLAIYRVNTVPEFPVGSTSEAVAALIAMADVAARGEPVTVAEGQWIRTEVRGLAGVCESDRCGLERQDGNHWYDPEGGRAYSTGVDGQPSTVALGEVGIARPTIDWFASLPSDPGRLLAHLRAAVDPNPTWSVDHQLWDAMAHLYSYFELALTPARRASVLRALAGVNGLSVRGVVVDGVSLIALRMTEKTDGPEIIFDPLTGHAVGRASVYLGGDVIVYQASGEPTLDSGVLHQMTWTQTVTNRLG